MELVSSLAHKFSGFIFILVTLLVNLHQQQCDSGGSQELNRDSFIALSP